MARRVELQELLLTAALACGCCVLDMAACKLAQQMAAGREALLEDLLTSAFSTDGGRLTHGPPSLQRRLGDALKKRIVTVGVPHPVGFARPAKHCKVGRQGAWAGRLGRALDRGGWSGEQVAAGVG